MSKLIQGVHHIAVKPTAENYKRTVVLHRASGYGHGQELGGSGAALPNDFLRRQLLHGDSQR